MPNNLELGDRVIVLYKGDPTRGIIIGFEHRLVVISLPKKKVLRAAHWEVALDEDAGD